MHTESVPGIEIAHPLDGTAAEDAVYAHVTRPDTELSALAWAFMVFSKNTRCVIFKGADL